MDSTIKTLIVDDDSIVRTFLVKLIINKFGFDTVQAGNGIEALKVLEHDEPDIVFLDISMPVMNGIEFLSTVRQQPKYKNLPIIAITAHSDKATVKQLVDLGIQDYILKPLSYNETYSRLREIIAEQRATINKNRQKIVEFDDDIQKKTLLLIEPNQDFANYFKTLLSFNFDVIIGHSGAECLDLYVKKEPTVVVISVDVDSSRGGFIVSKLKELDYTDNIKIFGLSDTFSDAESVGSYNAILKKSYFPSVMLHEVVSKVLGKESVAKAFPSIFEKNLPFALRDYVKAVFIREANVEISRKGNDLFNNNSDFITVYSGLKTPDDSIRLVITMKSEEVVKIKLPGLQGNKSPYDSIIYLNDKLADKIMFELGKFGLALEKSKVSDTDAPLGYTKSGFSMSFDTDEGDLFEITFNLYVK